MYTLVAYDKDNDYYENLKQGTFSKLLDEMISLLPKLKNDELRRKDVEPFDWLFIEDENQKHVVGSWEI
jgi:hypothetical protein